MPHKDIYSIIRYWLKIVSMNDNKYAKFIYNMLLEDMRQNPDKINWASSVKHLLSNYGFMNVWLSQGVENSNSFLQHFKQRVRDIFIQECHARLENSTRARFYGNIDNFKYQTYLDTLTIKTFQHNLTRLRVSSHKLEVDVVDGLDPRGHLWIIENVKCAISWKTSSILYLNVHFTEILESS